MASVLPPVKSVVVYKNGDPFYTGRRFVVNQRQVATMEAFLNEVTQSIRAPLAIRTLYTPRQGHRVSDLQHLQTGAQYVAAGFEKFKKMDYLNMGVKKHPTAREETQAKVIPRPNVSAKWRKFIPVPCILHVFRNGDLLCPPFRFIIPRSMRQDLEQILGLITDKVSLRTGAVRRLCTLEGATVSSAAELETGHYYVAVGTERLKKLPYVELLLSKDTERYYADNRKAESRPEDQYSDSALLDSPESDGRRIKSTGDNTARPAVAPQRSRRQKVDESSVFFAKPAKIGHSRRPRPPMGNGSIQPNMFKTAAQKRGEEAPGAEEVHEDENTAVEIPVDQRVAEIVEDEEINTRGAPTDNSQQRHKQILTPEQHNDGRCQHTQNGEQMELPSEQGQPKQTENAPASQQTSAETLESELNHTSSSSLPSSSTIRDDEEKASVSRLHPNKMKIIYSVLIKILVACFYPFLFFI
eukprot:XP_011617810.1 PREDICTED: doublecortin domain-containing protein 2B [Takifugu rubripes]